MGVGRAGDVACAFDMRFSLTGVVLDAMNCDAHPVCVRGKMGKREYNAEPPESRADTFPAQPYLELAIVELGLAVDLIEDEANKSIISVLAETVTRVVDSLSCPADPEREDSDEQDGIVPDRDDSPFDEPEPRREYNYMALGRPARPNPEQTAEDDAPIRLRKDPAEALSLAIDRGDAPHLASLVDEMVAQRGGGEVE